MIVDSSGVVRNRVCPPHTDAILRERQPSSGEDVEILYEEFTEGGATIMDEASEESFASGTDRNSVGITSM